MNESMGIDKSNTESINRWLDDHPGISGREAGRMLGIHESYIRRAKAARSKGTTMRLKISDIRITTETQPRVQIDTETVTSYRVAKENGAKFLPPVVFHDGSAYHMGDGAHRTAADVAIGLTEIECEVRQGGEKEAFSYALLANLQNGLQLNSADRKRAYWWLVANEPGLTGREYARRVGVDEKQVRRWKEEVEQALERSKAAEYGMLPSDYRQMIAIENGSSSGDVVDDLSTEESLPDGSPVVDGAEAYSDPDPAPRLPSLAVTRPLLKLPDPVPDSADMSAGWEGESEEVPSQTDDEWLATMPIRERLSPTCLAVFDRDALVFKHFTEAESYLSLATLGNRLLDKKTPGLKGRYHSRLSSFLRTKHPRSWLLCDLCKGVGCDQCNRGGYGIS